MRKRSNNFSGHLSEIIWPRKSRIMENERNFQRLSILLAVKNGVVAWSTASPSDAWHNRGAFRGAEGECDPRTRRSFHQYGMYPTKYRQGFGARMSGHDAKILLPSPPSTGKVNTLIPTRVGVLARRPNCILARPNETKKFPCSIGSEIDENIVKQSDGCFTRASHVEEFNLSFAYRE